MSWTPPKTWTEGESISTADLNLYLRDNANRLLSRPGFSVSSAATQTIPPSQWTSLALEGGYGRPWMRGPFAASPYVPTVLGSVRHHFWIPESGMWEFGAVVVCSDATDGYTWRMQLRVRDYDIEAETVSTISDIEFQTQRGDQLGMSGAIVAPVYLDSYDTTENKGSLVSLMVQHDNPSDQTVTQANFWCLWAGEYAS